VIALTDVLDADRQLLTAQDELAQTRADSARAAVGTFRALVADVTSDFNLFLGAQPCLELERLSSPVPSTRRQWTSRPAHPRKPRRTQNCPQLAEVAVVQPAEVGERAFTGVVSARVQSNLGFRVSGKVIERVVDSGEAVHQGQPLMRLDRTDYVHAITTQVGNVDAARARLQQAAADEARYSGLVSSGAVSQSAYDQVKAAADSARALLSAAEAQLKVAQDEGAYATLVADADGTVMETLAERDNLFPPARSWSAWHGPELASGGQPA